MSNRVLQTLIVEATDRKREALRKINLPNQNEQVLEIAYGEYEEACRDLKILYGNERYLERQAG